MNNQKPFVIESSLFTHVGKRREHNEDYALSFPDRGLFILADGMGGHEKGEIASALACQTVSNYLLSSDEIDLVESIKHADLSIRQHPEYLMMKMNKQKAMGTTLVIVQIYQNLLIDIAWVGDSRAYMLYKHNLIPLTKDQTWIQKEKDFGNIGHEEAKHHEKRHMLLQALGHGTQVMPDSIRTEIHLGSKILLCSDGLTEHLNDPQIAEIMRKHDSVDSIGRELIQAALAGGGSDNITVLLVELKKQD